MNVNCTNVSEIPGNASKDIHFNKMLHNTQDLYIYIQITCFTLL